MADDCLAEEWRPVEGFAGYEVSSFGRVRSWLKNGPGGNFRDHPRIMSPSHKANGYLQVNLWKDGERSTVGVHVLVVSAFEGPKPFEEAQCRHRDGDKHHNAAMNLLWGSAADNSGDSVRQGVHPGFKIRGEAHYRSTLTEETAEKIRQMASGGATQSEIAAATGVPQGTVQSIVLRYGWAYGEDRRYGAGHFSKAERQDRAAERAKKGWLSGVGGKPSITAEIVLEIRTLAQTMPQARLCERFGMSRQMISKIVNRITWKHV